MLVLPEDILKAHKFRFACKEFDEKRMVSKEDINLILEVGRLSPSSFGFEPWKFLVIEDELVKERIKSSTWGLIRQMPGLSYLVIILAMKEPHMMYYSKHIKYMMEDIQEIPEDAKNARLDRYKNFLEYDFELLDNDRDIFDWACKQTYIPLANMMTTAASVGIDSCPVEGFNREKLEKQLEKLGILNREKFGVSVMVSFGYRKKEPLREKTRRPFNEVVEWIR